VTCEVNNSTCYNSLPYIQLSYPPVKLLIDTGCYKSIIRPGIAEKYFPFDIYHEPSKIKTSTGEKPIRFKAKTQAFPELNNDKIIEFLLFDFHEYFDGILGLKDLREMKLSINLVDKILTNGIMKIPFYYRQPDETSHTVSVNSHEILKTKLPVNCNNGDVIILEQTINDLYIPETLTTAKDGFALMEIHNRTDSRIDLILFEPLKTVNFSEINAIENDDTSSVIANVGDTTQMIDEYLKNEHLTPVSENPSYMDSPIPPPDHLRNDDITSNISKPTPSTTLSNSVTHGSKINIISNIQIKPPDKNPSDNETVHSALENPVITIPITDKPLNHYKNQVILFCSRNILKPNVQQTTIFNKNRLTISLPTNNIESHIINVIKEYVDSKQNYTLYFKTLELADIFNNVIQSCFKNSSFKFIKSTILLQDIVNSDQQTEKLIYHHQGKTCHKGINEMKTSIERNFYWPDLIKDITNFVNNCVTCQVSKYERNPPVLKFNLTPTASKPLEHIHIDTFKISNNSFLTILDAFSRYGQAYHIASLSPINIIDSLLVFISHHGLPNKITADRGSEFKNNSLENFCELHKIELHFTTSKNSNSNSPVERFHSTLAEEIRCLKIDKPHENITSLMNYNNAIHSVTGHTPFEVLKGHLESTHPFDLTDGKIISNYIQNHKEKTNIIYNQIKEKLNNNKEILISKLNENRETPKEFKTNDPAYITTKERNKAKPKFIKTNVLSDQNDKLVTHRGTYHKSATKNPRKIHQKALFQRTIQHDLPNNNPNNIGEPTNDERH
jgi:hypothetical protein